MQGALTYVGLKNVLIQRSCGRILNCASVQLKESFHTAHVKPVGGRIYQLDAGKLVLKALQNAKTSPRRGGIL